MRASDPRHVNNVESNQGPQHVPVAPGVALVETIASLTRCLQRLETRLDHLEARSSHHAVPPHTGLAFMMSDKTEVRENNPSHAISQSSTVIESFGSGTALARDVSEVIFDFGDTVPPTDA